MYIVTYIVVIQTFVCFLHLSLRVWMYVLEQLAVDVLQIVIYIFGWSSHCDSCTTFPTYISTFRTFVHYVFQYGNLHVSGLKSL